MGNTFGPKGFWSGSEPTCLVIEVSQIIIHEAAQPDVVLDLFDADGLAGEDDTEVDLLAIVADAAAGGDDDGLVVKRIIEVRQASIAAR
ncbi:hypothetical protein [Mesorhizobium caraganae]|uniref:hypothetical protein n=1 Tax=Mesorhizobium caraganae TaxID=483206 RepID=UPI001785DEBA|nr:hypothetical protein [Mesorhizobium caraganae]